MSSSQNTTRRNKPNARNRANRVRALSLGQPLPVASPLTFKAGNNYDVYAERKLEELRKSLEENTEFNNNNWAPQSIKNYRAGLPEHNIISRMQNRMAAEIAQAEATGRSEVVFRFPLGWGKKLLQALTFLLSILTLPAKFLVHLFGMVRAKVSPPAAGTTIQEWGAPTTYTRKNNRAEATLVSKPWISPNLAERLGREKLGSWANATPLEHPI